MGKKRQVSHGEEFQKHADTPLSRICTFTSYSLSLGGVQWLPSKNIVWIG